MLQKPKMLYNVMLIYKKNGLFRKKVRYLVQVFFFLHMYMN